MNQNLKCPVCGTECIERVGLSVVDYLDGDATLVTMVDGKMVRNVMEHKEGEYIAEGIYSHLICVNGHKCTFGVFQDVENTEYLASDDPKVCRQACRIKVLLEEVE